MEEEEAVVLHLQFLQSAITECNTQIQGLHQAQQEYSNLTQLLAHNQSDTPTLLSAFGDTTHHNHKVVVHLGGCWFISTTQSNALRITNNRLQAITLSLNQFTHDLNVLQLQKADLQPKDKEVVGTEDTEDTNQVNSTQSNTTPSINSTLSKPSISSSDLSPVNVQSEIAKSVSSQEFKDLMKRLNELEAEEDAEHQMLLEMDSDETDGLDNSHSDSDQELLEQNNQEEHVIPITQYKTTNEQTESPSATQGQSQTESPSATQGQSQTESPSATQGQSQTESPSATQGQSQTESPSATQGQSQTESPSATQGQSQTESPSATQGQSQTPSQPKSVHFAACLECPKSALSEQPVNRPNSILKNRDEKTPINLSAVLNEPVESDKQLVQMDISMFPGEVVERITGLGEDFSFGRLVKVDESTETGTDTDMAQKECHRTQPNNTRTGTDMAQTECHRTQPNNTRPMSLFKQRLMKH